MIVTLTHWIDSVLAGIQRRSRAIHTSLIASVIVFSTLIPFLAIPKIGVSWDEPFQRHYGQVMISYLHHGDRALFLDKERYYGPLVPLLLQVPEGLCRQCSLETIYECRHWINWILFILSFPFLYGIGRHLRFSKTRSLWTALVIITTPIIAGHALFNSKDIPFMTVSIIGTWAMLRFRSNRSLNSAIALGLAFGAMLLCRINAIATIGAMVGIDLITEKVSLKSVKYSPIYLGLAGIITVAGWPTLWFDPINELSAAIQLMFNSPWGDTVLFNGEFIRCTNLPWFYIPVWMGITLNPILFGLFITMIPVCFVKWSRRFGDHAAIWITVLPSILSLFATLVLHPVLYDSWRHLFFIFPAVVIVVSYGLNTLFDGRWRALEGVFWGVITIGTITTWVTYFPYTHCYLNGFAGPRESVIYNWEVDYWGVSYRELLESVGHGSIFPDNPPVQTAILMLKDRFSVTESDRPKDADFLVTNHRWRTGPLHLPIAYQVNRDGVNLSTAYRLRSKHMPGLEINGMH